MKNRDFKSYSHSSAKSFRKLISAFFAQAHLYGEMKRPGFIFENVLFGSSVLRTLPPAHVSVGGVEYGRW